MSVYYVLAVVVHALPTGGTRRSSSALRHCSKLIDGFVTGKTLMMISTNVFNFNLMWSKCEDSVYLLAISSGFAAGMTWRMNGCRHWRRMRGDYIGVGLLRIAKLPTPKASILQMPFTRWRLGICFRCLWRSLRAGNHVIALQGDHGYELVTLSSSMKFSNSNTCFL